MTCFTRSRHLLAALSLASLTTAGIIPEVNPFNAIAVGLTKRDDPWPWGVIGDSWASGVAYNKDVLYDDNKDKCLRTKESHGPQLEADSDLFGHEPSGLRDAACSGSQFVDLAKNQYQMGKVGNPNLVVMTSGGNNAGFGRIVDVCIYHSDPRHDYGPAYKDDKNRKGDCAKALNDAKEYIENPDKMRDELIITLDDILKDNHVKDNPDFLLYLTGYARFFGPDYDQWCNSETWRIPNPYSAIPYLSEELRRAFNDHLVKVNDLYKKTVEEKYSKQVRYVNIDLYFDGHRFCESGHNHGDQLNTDTKFDKVYLWNLNWPWQVNSAVPQQSEPVTPEDVEKIFANEKGVTAWGGSGSGSGSGNGGNEPDNGTYFPIPIFLQSPFHLHVSISWIPTSLSRLHYLTSSPNPYSTQSRSSPVFVSQPLTSHLIGWRLRPFHPRYSGYKAIKDAILDQIKKDGLPNSVPRQRNQTIQEGMYRFVPTSSSTRIVGTKYHWYLPLIQIVLLIETRMRILTFSN